MVVFLVGLLCGGASGGLTYLNTADPQISLIVGIIVAVLVWVLRGAWAIVANIDL